MLLLALQMAALNFAAIEREFLQDWIAYKNHKYLSI